MVRNQKAKETTKGKDFAKKAIEKAHQELRGPSHHSCKQGRRSPPPQDILKQFELKLVFEGEQSNANDTTTAIGQNYIAFSGSVPNKIILPDPFSKNIAFAAGEIANETSKQFCCSSTENLSLGVGVEIETSALRN